MQSIFLLSNNDIHTILALIAQVELDSTLIQEEKDLRERLKEAINAKP